MAKRSTSTTESVYQIKITLLQCDPPIWRRILVPGNTTLARLHSILQAAMGWGNMHLHEFLVDGKLYGGPHSHHGADVKNEKTVTLTRVAPKVKSKILYTYNFSEGWQHEIIVEKISALEEGVRYPKCIDGDRSCPPEDCGGIRGYAELIDVINDPEHPDRNEMLEWVGDDFDPDDFSPNAVNIVLKRVK
ncbi:MAG: plasmid pRiA4b ORF-3 family protein [Candidatus Hydrogenedentes bacterium]|nr:plasmid pRiA4b ORF-3 family protein [Candidatus Hydrogenedentota bacterium]